jgi:glutamine synthetase adenylyltransferase
MSTPNIKKLEKLEKELTRFFSHNKRLDSDDLSDDARFIRAWFLHIALTEIFPMIPTQEVVQYLKYGTDETISNTLIWMVEQIKANPQWKVYINTICQQVTKT